MVNVTKWVDSLIKLPEVVARLGNVKFCQKVIAPQLAKVEEKAKPVV